MGRQIYVNLKKDEVRFLCYLDYYRQHRGNPRTPRSEAGASLIHFALDQLEQEYNPCSLNNAMMLRIDKQGVINDVSESWLRFFGYRRPEVIGRESLEFMSKKQGFSATPPDLEREYITKAGKVVRFRVLTTPMNGDNETVSIFELA